PVDVTIPTAELHLSLIQLGADAAFTAYPRQGVQFASDKFNVKCPDQGANAPRRCETEQPSAWAQFTFSPIQTGLTFCV
ncbi:MAG: hypothetical protein ACKPKO_18465, partial [Candidatus Fonsibacter sp.]